MGRRGQEILLTLRDVIEIALWLIVIVGFITRGYL